MKDLLDIGTNAADSALVIGNRIFVQHGDTTYTAPIMGTYVTAQHVLPASIDFITPVNGIKRDLAYLRNIYSLLIAYIPHLLVWCETRYGLLATDGGRGFSYCAYMLVLTEDFLMRINCDGEHVFIRVGDFAGSYSIESEFKHILEINQEVDDLIYDLINAHQRDWVPQIRCINEPMYADLPYWVVTFCEFINADVVFQSRTENTINLLFWCVDGMRRYKFRDRALYDNQDRIIAEPSHSAGKLFSIADAINRKAPNLRMREIADASGLFSMRIMKLPRYARACNIYEDLLSLPHGRSLVTRYYSTKDEDYCIYRAPGIGIWVDARREKIYFRMQDSKTTFGLSEARQMLIDAKEDAFVRGLEKDRISLLRSISRR